LCFTSDTYKEIIDRIFFVQKTYCKEEKPSPCSLSCQIKTCQPHLNNQSKYEKKEGADDDTKQRKT